MVVGQRVDSVTEFEQVRAQNPDRLLELIDGRIIEKVVKPKHGFIASLISSAFNRYLSSKQIGIAAVESIYKVEKDEHNFRVLDVAVYLGDEQKILERNDHYECPALAVEIKSEDNTLFSLLEKADYLLKTGVGVVWLVYPEIRTVEVYSAGSVVPYQLHETISGDPLLPGLEIKVNTFLHC